MGIGDRIKQERERLGLSQDEFSKYGKVTRKSQFNYESEERMPDASYLEGISQVGVDIQFIITGQRGRDLVSEERTEYRIKSRHDHETHVKVQQNENSNLISDFVMVPRYDVRASAGHGSLVHSELIVDYLAFREEWISRIGLSSEKLALIKVTGDSMFPTLNNNDLVLIDLRVQKLGVDDIYTIQHRGHLLVKRIQIKMDGTVVIKSDNPLYESEALCPADAENLIVMGRVVWFGREI